VPTEEEIAAELGLGLEEYHEWLVELRGINVGSLEHSPREEEGRDLLRFLSDNEEEWPSRLYEKQELLRMLGQAISRMPSIERTILGLYYQNELTLREISRVVNLHESRVSQLKTQAILRLRTLFEKRWPTGRGL
jgi:RNA polymerase sigma factor for flagellar operon FliA